MSTSPHVKSAHSGSPCRMIGLYHVQMSKYGSDPVESRYSFMKAAAAYLEAATKYPEDDESHACKCSSADSCARLIPSLQGS
jgi:hypothetical protein